MVKEPSIPVLEEILDIYAHTPEGIPLWKTKGMKLDFTNLLANIFVLSSDLAYYFDIVHKNLTRNIRKLQQEGYLNHALKIERMVQIGSSAQRAQTIYALTKHQTELLTLDFSGAKARKKKFQILIRLHAIETDVLQGDYHQAREKAQDFDGVQLLKEMNFHFSVDNYLATKKDIAAFLHIPQSTVNSFLTKQKDQIKPIKLDIPTIQRLGSSANRMNAYCLEDVLKVVFWIQSEVSMELKQRLLGKRYSMLLKNETRKEMEWRAILTKIFEGLDLRYNHSIGSYRVDFFVMRLSLCLELDEDHRSYDLAQEEEREKYISRHYTLIRFNNQTSLETLINTILKAQIREVINLYA